MATATAPTRSYGGESATQRRAVRREQLLAAGLELLGSESEDTTVRGVCERARLTPRYFYESFENLDELLVAIFDRIVAEASTVILAAVEQAPAEAHAKSRAGIGSFVDYLTEDPRRARVAFVEGRALEPLVRRRAAAMRQFSDLLAGQAREFYGAGREAKPLLDLTASLLVGGLAELLMSWLGGDLDLGRDELVEDVTELFVATGEASASLAARRARTGRSKRGQSA